MISERVALRVRNTETDVEETVVGQLTAREVADLSDFLACVETLQSARFVRDGLAIEWAIEFNPGQPARNPHPLPDSTNLREFALVLRPFILDDEPTAFHRVRSLLVRKLDHPYTRYVSRELKVAYSGNTSQQVYRIVYNGEVLNSEESLRLWLNATIYHRSPDLREAMSNLRAAFPADVSDALFVSMLAAKAHAVLTLARFIRDLDWGNGPQAVSGPAV